MNKHKVKIVVTGGHFTPALAVVEELRTRGLANFVWVGHKYAQTGSEAVSAEYKKVSELGIRFIALKAGKIWRKWTLGTLFKGIYNLVLIPLGILQSLWIIIRERPQLVISFGGYLAVPLVISAWLLGVKVITHEQTVVTGQANKLIARFADKVLISWTDSAKYFDAEKTVFVGNPIRREVLAVTTDQFNFNNDLPLIYVTGGNQGANTINRRLAAFLPQLLEHANVIQQTGNSTLTQDYAKAKKQREELPESLRERYLVFDNIYGAEIGEILQKASLIVSRAGANTIAEVLALGKLAILIPIPWTAQNEQLLNAKLVAKTGLGYLLEQYDAMPASELQKAIEQGLECNRNKQDFLGRNLHEAQAAARELVTLDAPKRFADEVEQLLLS